jgi:hypothetical protein
MSSRCLGITVKDTAEGLLSFAGGEGKFHIPFRCDRVAGSKGLCTTCLAKEEKTAAKVSQMKPGNTTIGGQLPSFLNGRVGEPIPYWTRLYDGAWYRLKVEEGATLSEATMGKVKKAVADAYEGEAQPPPAPMPGGKGAKKGGGGRKKKEAVPSSAPAPSSPTVMEALAVAAAKPAEPATNTVVPVAAVATAPSKPAQPTVKKTVTRKPATKKAANTPVEVSAPVARISPETQPTPVEDIVTATVKKTELGGRSVYLEAQKGKVYDLKFHYLGRWDSKKEKIVAHPDSDAEC